MKICHVITRMIIGGAQENTFLSCLGQAQAGHEVVLLTGPTEGPEGKLLAVKRPENFEVVEIPELLREIRPCAELQAYRKMRRFFRERKFDVVHTHTSKAGILGRAAAWAENIPCVVHTVHGQAFHPYQSFFANQLYKALERYGARHCDRIFTVAQAMIDQCLAAGIGTPNQFRVVYSGMEMSSFLAARRSPELRQTLGLPQEALVVATLARLFAQKGYEFVIPAAQQVLERFPETHFLLIGDGIMRPQLEEQCRKLGIADRIHFAGLISPDRVPEYLAQADLLWHLSLHEGLPRSAVQALATGIPVVAFDLDGTPEVVLNGLTGYCVPPEDADAVAQRSLELLEDPALRQRLGDAGRRLVESQFDWPKMAQKLLQEYQEILNTKMKQKKKKFVNRFSK